MSVVKDRGEGKSNMMTSHNSIFSNPDPQSKGIGRGGKSNLLNRTAKGTALILENKSRKRRGKEKEERDTQFILTFYILDINKEREKGEREKSDRSLGSLKSDPLSSEGGRRRKGRRKFLI